MAQSIVLFNDWERDAGPPPEHGRPIQNCPKNRVSVFLDVTEDNLRRGFIVRIRAVRYVPAEERQFMSLIRPPIAPYKGKYTPYGFSRKTGITHEDLMTAPRLYHVMKEFSGFIDSLPLIGHSMSRDILFLQDAFDRFMPNPLINDYADTQQMAEALYPGLKDYSLKAMAKKFKLNKSGTLFEPCEQAEDLLVRITKESERPEQMSLWT